jgi:hypothetical protein
MINIIVGTVAEGPLKGRYTFKIEPNWYAEYQKDDNIISKGRFCINDEDIIYDPDLGEIHKTLYAIEIQGPGKVAVAQIETPVVGKEKRFRFYQKV